MKHVLVPLASVALVLFAACKSRDAARAPAGDADASPVTPEAEPAVALEDTEWRLADLGGKPALPGLGTRAASITFVRESASVSGNTGVNSLFGPYALDGARLRIENLGMTRMAASPELMEQEKQFVAALQAARSFRIEGADLLLLGADGAALARLRAQR